MIRELNRYDITVAALQETLWFGKHVYLVGESVVITSGRETPQGHQSGQRGEGVAVVLTQWPCKRSMESWRRAMGVMGIQDCHGLLRSGWRED